MPGDTSLNPISRFITLILLFFFLIPRICFSNSSSNNVAEPLVDSVAQITADSQPTAVDTLFTLTDKTESVTEKKEESSGESYFFSYPLLRSEKMDQLIIKLENYGNENIPRNFRASYLKLVNLCFTYPVVFFLVLFILFFIVNILIVFSVLNYTIRKKRYNARYQEVYRKMYEEALMLYLFGVLDWDETYRKLRKVSRKKNRQILTSILLNFHENLKGEVDKFIPEIYLKLNLQKDSFKAARSFFSHKKVQGIRELTFLNPQGAIDMVSGLINVSDQNVRAEAQIAYIRLHPSKPFRFLKNITKAFAPWTQLSAFYLIRLHQMPVPSFAKYLYSKHPTVRNFSLKMINYFQQLENVDEVYKMLDSKMEITRFLAYRAINDLRLDEARVLLKNKFRDETKKNKVEIVKAFKNIGTADDFDFLELILRIDSVSLRLEACRSLYFMSTDGKNRLLALNEKGGNDLEGFIAHITDPRN